MSVDAIVLFRAVWTVFLAARFLRNRVLRFFCLHCISPRFFGSRHSIDRWKKSIALTLFLLLMWAGEFMQMLFAAGRRMVSARFSIPVWTAKFCFSPRPKKYMDKIGATFWQREKCLASAHAEPKRRDTLFLISREANVRDCLLRPLSAQHLPPTPMEENGLVNRDLLTAIAGRGRSEQRTCRKIQTCRNPNPGGRLPNLLKRKRASILADSEALSSRLRCGHKQEPPANGARIIKAHEDFRLSGIGRQIMAK